MTKINNAYYLKYKIHWLQYHGTDMYGINGGSG